MKKIATIIAALIPLYSGAALAQGIPPGFGAWQSSWPAFVTVHPSQETGARKAGRTRSDRDGTIARNGGSGSIAGNVLDAHRRS